MKYTFAARHRTRTECKRVYASNKLTAEIFILLAIESSTGDAAAVAAERVHNKLTM